ncbi:MAG: hypothetical protein ACOYD9_02255 [Pyramidobacter sp.]
MSIYERWASDTYFWTADPKTGEQEIFDNGKIIKLTPDDRRWHHDCDNVYYKHHLEAKVKYKKHYNEFKKREAEEKRQKQTASHQRTTEWAFYDGQRSLRMRIIKY